MRPRAPNGHCIQASEPLQHACSERSQYVLDQLEDNNFDSLRGVAYASASPPEVKMAANDVLALDANFKSWSENRFPNPQKGVNVFEYYCIEQFARSFDLGDSQLKSGMVGAGQIVPSKQPLVRTHHCPGARRRGQRGHSGVAVARVRQ